MASDLLLETAMGFVRIIQIGFFLSLWIFCLEGEASVTLVLKQIQKKEPTFSEIVHVAIQKEHLQSGQIEKLQKKMKQAPWLPALSVGYDHALRETSAISVTDNISVTNSGVTVGPEGNDLDLSNLQGSTLRIRAVWSLSELVFHPSSLSLHKESRDLTAQRMQFTDYLFKIYAERKSALAEYYLVHDSTKKTMLGEKIEALTGKLDAMTGGIFMNRWWRVYE